MHKFQWQVCSLIFEDQHSKNRQFHTLLLCFSWNSFFAFLAVSYVLKRFVYLEISNRETKWYKGKKIIFLWSILQTCQLENPVFIYKLNCQSSLWFTVSCEFIYLIEEQAEWNANLSFTTFNVSHMPTGNTGFWINENVCKK